MMTEFEEDVKMEYLNQFLEGGGSPVRISPQLTQLSVRLTLEEETEATLFIMQEMPYLELFYDSTWKETMVRQIKPIPVEDQLFYYKKSCKEAENLYCDTMNAIQKTIDGILS